MKSSTKWLIGIMAIMITLVLTLSVMLCNAQTDPVTDYDRNYKKVVPEGNNTYAVYKLKGEYRVNNPDYKGEGVRLIPWSVTKDSLLVRITVLDDLKSWPSYKNAGGYHWLDYQDFMIRAQELCDSGREQPVDNFVSDTVDHYVWTKGFIFGVYKGREVLAKRNAADHIDMWSVPMEKCEFSTGYFFLLSGAITVIAILLMHMLRTILVALVVWLFKSYQERKKRNKPSVGWE